MQISFPNILFLLWTASAESFEAFLNCQGLRSKQEFSSRSCSPQDRLSTAALGPINLPHWWTEALYPRLHPRWALPFSSAPDNWNESLRWLLNNASLSVSGYRKPVPGFQHPGPDGFCITFSNWGNVTVYGSWRWDVCFKSSDNRSLTSQVI